jgi:probable F420-dependent oxidoreductase
VEEVGVKFGVGLFTGQIPSWSDRSFHQEYRDYIELARAVEEAGLDSAWVSEHHFAEDGYLPSLLPLLAAFAAVTERIELGTGVVLAPFHDPIRLAEDYAVVDQISGGRVICGLGIGWREEEFRAFDIDTSSRTRRLREIVEILKLSWSEERFDYDGKYYKYSSIAVTPKPARQIPVLVGGFVDEAIKRAGRIADGYLSSRAQPERVAQAFDMASEERKKAGHAGEPIVGLLQNSFVTEDPDRDWDMVAAGAGHQLGVYAGWRAGTDVKGESLRVMPPDEDELRKMTAYGTPGQVVDYLGPIVDVLDRYNEAHLVLRLHYPGMDAAPARGAIELLAGEVVPQLRSRSTAP